VGVVDCVGVWDVVEVVVTSGVTVGALETDGVTVTAGVGVASNFSPPKLT
tara:strand:+ start:556 stop:705 length:150 start_codon:yes stop_codon:yes gene_type:complete